MSSKSDTPDIVYASDTSLQTFARNGWFGPLDDLWAKYRDEYQPATSRTGAQDLYLRGQALREATHRQEDRCYSTASTCLTPPGKPAETFAD